MTGTVIDDYDERLDALERDLHRFRMSRDGWTITIFGIAVLTVFASIIGIGLALRADGDDAVAGGETVEADMTEFSVDLSTADIETPGTLLVRNNGTVVHNLTIVGTDVRSSDLQAGESEELDISALAPGTYTVNCIIPGHTEAGMTASLTVGGGADGAAAVDGHDGHTPTPAEGAAQDQVMIESVLAFPAETEGRGNQTLEPEVLPDGTKRFELTASVIDWEVRPGEIVQAWAYNGMVPGPRIDLDVGDAVQVEITNELPIGTDIHWHGIDVPNDQDGVSPITQNLVTSGSVYTYEFTVTEAAIGMYHAHAHAHESVPNGLFGTMYVGDVGAPIGRSVSGIDVPADLEIAHDLPMVLNDAGVIGLSLDGKSFPATTPIVVQNGEWLRLTYFNEGLQVHPMHLHGFEQLVIAKDGEPLDSPYAADTVLVAPGERYTVLVHATAPGTWVWHCHILNHVESNDGMFGMVTALVVQDAT